MDTPWRHSHHGGCRSAISLLAILLVGAVVITACSDLNSTHLNNSSTTPPRPEPVVSLTAEPSSVGVNDSSTLTWLVRDAASCEASGAWSGSKPLSGSESVGPLTATSAFTLACNGAGGSAGQSVTVSVNAPPPPPAATVSLTASPAAIDYNGSTTLLWSSTDATACSAGGAWSGMKATSGSESVGPLTATSAFTLACNGAGGSAGRSVTVAVNPAPLPTVALTANPTTVDMNGSSTLTWSSTDATSCDAGGAWSGSKPLSGNESVGPLTETSTFTLTCTGPGGSTNRPVTVSVLTEPEPAEPCSVSLFSPDLAGQFRSIPATMGALEVAGVNCQ